MTVTDNPDGVEMTAKTAAEYFDGLVNTGQFTVGLAGGYARYTDIRMTETYDFVRVERLNPVTQKMIRRYIGTGTPVVLHEAI